MSNIANLDKFGKFYILLFRKKKASLKKYNTYEAFFFGRTVMFLSILGKVFSKFYGKVDIIFWLLFHLIWKNYVLYWDFVLKSWIVDFFTHFTHEKTPQNNFSCQNFSVENNYFSSKCHQCRTDILMRKVYL